MSLWIVTSGTMDHYFTDHKSAFLYMIECVFFKCTPIMYELHKDDTTPSQLVKGPPMTLHSQSFIDLLRSNLTLDNIAECCN
jgi:hypothetical protein